MIYNLKTLGGNTILAYYEIATDEPNFLGVFKVPCYSGLDGQSKNAIIPNDECGDYYELTITGVAESYEALLSGDIYFQDEGTWSVDLYWQESPTNTDPDSATFLETIELQVNGSS